MKSPDLSQFKGIVAVVAAAGCGSRMSGDTPKQYLKINRQTILDITLSRLVSFAPIELVVLVISPQDNYFKHLEYGENEKVIIIEGGAERANSVHNALRFLYDSGLPDEAPVMVHDAARPCITHQDLKQLSDTYQNTNQACILTSEVNDTLQKVGDSNLIEQTLDRSSLVRAYTPQMASFNQLKTSLKHAIDNKLNVTDEASALLASNYAVASVNGRADNIKITRNDDLALAEFYLSKQESEK